MPPMQVFLPFKDFKKCVSILDTETLQRQRENCKKLIFMIIWKMEDYSPNSKLEKEFKKLENHPVFLLWYNNGKPFANSLFRYLECCNFELFNRKFKIEKYYWINKIIISNKSKYHNGNPPTPRRITSGYRVILICFNESYYKDKFYMTYKVYKKDIEKLKKSKERFRFSKFIGLRIK